MIYFTLFFLLLLSTIFNSVTSAKRSVFQYFMFCTVCVCILRFIAFIRLQRWYNFIKARLDIIMDFMSVWVFICGKLRILDWKWLNNNQTLENEIEVTQLSRQWCRMQVRHVILKNNSETQISESRAVTTCMK